MAMGRHSSWRKVAKRERRRRIRKQNAANRESCLQLTREEYQNWLNEQNILEQSEYEQIEKSNFEENEKWLESEKHAQKAWQKLQEKREKWRLQQLEQEAKCRMEWELEQEKKHIEQERLKEIEEEKKHKQDVFMKHLEEFLVGESSEPPSELLVSRETKPNSDPCPFFAKTACCRFGDNCSRNHKFPGISNVLLATNFYTHFGLDNASYTEYDTDVMLEYEESDRYKEFKEFFYDVVPEFEKFGRITQFKVCNNYEKHLRGNTFIEFAELRCAVAAYRAMHSRWYGGKQMSLQFCNISSWKSSICGLFARKRCPKGRSCNYFHVFKNPQDLYNVYETDTRPRESERSQRNTLGRWSESPEVELPRERHPTSQDKIPRSKDRRRARSRSRDRRRRRSRSKDRQRSSRGRAKRRSKSREKSKHRESSKNSGSSNEKENNKLI